MIRAQAIKLEVIRDKRWRFAWVILLGVLISGGSIAGYQLLIADRNAQPSGEASGPTNGSAPIRGGGGDYVRLAVSNVTESATKTTAEYGFNVATSTSASLSSAKLVVLDSDGKPIKPRSGWNLRADGGQSYPSELPAFYNFTSSNWESAGGYELATWGAWTLTAPANSSLSHQGDSIEVICGAPI